MKPTFALTLSPDGLRLSHRDRRGWLLVGEAALDDPQLGHRLKELRQTAEQLAPGAVTTKLVLPTELVLFTTLDLPPGEEDRIPPALEGLTYYDPADLVWDWVPEDEGIRLAAVARESLAEAENFAEENGFAPICFVALPEDVGSFEEEPFFGLTTHGMSLGLDPAELRGDEPAFVVGRAVITPAPERPEAAPAEPPKTAEFEDINEEVPARPAARPSEERERIAAAVRRVRLAPVPAPEPEPERVPVAEDEAAAEPEQPPQAEPVGMINSPQIALPEHEPEPEPVPEPALVTAPAPAVTTPRLLGPAGSAIVSRPKVEIEPHPRSFQDRADGFLARYSRMPRPGGSARNGIFLTGALVLGLVGVGVWANLQPEAPSVAQEQAVVTDAPAASEDVTELTQAPAQELPPLPQAMPLPDRALLDIAPAPQIPAQPPTTTEVQAVVAATVRRHAVALLDTEAAEVLIAEEAEATYEPAPLPEAALEPEETEPEGQVDVEAAPETAVQSVVQPRPNPAAAAWDLDEEGDTPEAAEAAQTPPRARPRDFVPAPQAEVIQDAVAGVVAEVAALDAPEPPTPEVLAGLRPRSRPDLPATALAEEKVPDPAPAVEAAFSLLPRARPGAMAALAADLEPELEAEATAFAIAASPVPLLRPEVIAAAPAPTPAAAAPEPPPPPAPVVAARPPVDARAVDAALAAALAAPGPQRQHLAEADDEPELTAPAPNIPTSASVAQQATVTRAINLRQDNLIGVYGTSGSRRALVRASNGRMMQLRVGDRYDGGQVAVIHEREVHYIKNGRTFALAMPQG